MQAVARVTFLVREYDEAIAFFIGVLGFTLLEDTTISIEKRWVIVSPPSSRGTALLLARASTAEQVSHIGKQAGGRVAFFLQTDDFWRDYQAMAERGVVFEETPREEAYGTVVVFRDLYGNRWDLVQPRAAEGSSHD